MLSRKRPRKPDFAHHIVRTHSLMLYTDLIEYDIAGDSKAPLLRFSSFFSKLKGNIITTVQDMNCQTFSNLQSIELLNFFSHYLYWLERYVWWEETLYLSVSLVLFWCLKIASNIHLWSKRRYHMIASRKVEIPFYRGFGRQRGRGFGVLAQNFVRTDFPSLRKSIVPAAKRVGADLLEFSVPKIADVFSDRKIFKIAAKSVGRQTLRKQLVSDSRKKSASRVIPTKYTKKPVGSPDAFLHLIPINHVEQFSVPNFCGSFWKPWWENPSMWRLLVIPRTRTLSYYVTRWQLHRVWCPNRSELLRWFETDVFGFAAEICQGSYLRSLQNRRI